MVGLYVVGFYITFHVPIPTFHTVFDGTESNAVQGAAVYGCISKMVSFIGFFFIQTSTFRPLGQQVVAEGIMQLQVAREALHHPLLLRFLFFFFYIYRFGLFRSSWNGFYPFRHFILSI